MKVKQRFAAWGLAFLTAAVGGCQKPYHAPEERYVLVAPNVSLSFWQEAEAGLEDIGKNLGVHVEMVGPNTFSPTEELAAFEQTVAQHPSGILVSVSDPKRFREPIDAAILEGLPVISIDGDAPESHRILFIGTDNFRAGEESGRRMAELLGGQGRVVAISIGEQLNLEERVRGMNEAFKKFPAIKVVETVDDGGDARAAFDGVSSLLQKHEKIDGVVCLEASGGSGAADALHQMDLAGKIKIVAFDKDPETLDGIDRQWISATIVQKPYVMAFYGVRFLDDLHHNAVHEFKDWATAPVSPLPTFVGTGTAVIDRGNLALFRKALAEQPRQNP